MKLIFIGTGSAFTVGTRNFQSNMVLEDSKSSKRLLIDCGSDARLALYELGFGYSDIDAVYISHLHADHVGGMEWLALTTYFNLHCKKPHLYIAKSLQKTLWHNVLSGGLNSLPKKSINLATFFQVHPVGANNKFKWESITFRLIKTEHIYSYNKLLPSYGLFFRIFDKNIFITTDTKFIPKQFMPWYKKADVIFHDCETGSKKTSVHARYEELKTLPSNIKKKMWLYAYDPEPLPDAQQEGFLGFVKKGQVFDFS